MLELDRRGVAGVAVLSSEFEPAAQAWTAMNGFDAGRVFVAHPIQPRTDEEMRALADEAVERVVALLEGG